MSLQAGGEDRGPGEWPSGAKIDATELTTIPRWMVACVVASLGLIAATFFIAGWRPLFGGSGFGLVIELISCAAGIVLALAATITNLGYLSGRNIGLRNRLAVVVVSVIVALACLLDVFAAAVAALRT